MDKRFVGINYGSLKNSVIKAVFSKKMKIFKILKLSSQTNAIFETKFVPCNIKSSISPFKQDLKWLSTYSAKAKATSTNVFSRLLNLYSLYNNEKHHTILQFSEAKNTKEDNKNPNN